MPKKKILIVDDDIEFCFLVKDILEHTGDYTVETECTGTRAPDTARKFRPDLILMDVILGPVEGGEVARAIVSDPDLEKTPIVFMTGLVATENEIDTKGGVVGGRPFLAKPVTLERLVNAIETNTA